MKENNSKVTDINVEDIEEALEKLSTGKKIKMCELLRTFKREGIENFVTTRKKYVDVILSDYKRVLKENEELKALDLSNSKMIANMSTRHFHDREKIRNSIPKQKIKDKIEELEKDEYSKYYDMFLEERDLKYTIQILQELLEESEGSKDGEN